MTSTNQLPLTTEQLRAVEQREGPLLLVAGAGSGKTTVLVERFVRMVCEDHIDPSKLLAVTFTEKAAGELRERVRARLQQLGERVAAREVELAWITTIHGLCARMLRTDPLAAGLDPQFVMLDQRGARRFMDEAFRDALNIVCGDSQWLDTLAAYGSDRLFRTTVATHELLREQGSTQPILPLPPSGGSLTTAHKTLHIAAQRALNAFPEHEKHGVRVQAARKKFLLCQQLLGDLLENQPLTPAHICQLQVSPRAAAALNIDPVLAYIAVLADYSQLAINQLATPALNLHRALLQTFTDCYAQKKQRSGALDFVDLQLMARDLLRNSEQQRTYWSQRFERAMVDEFQDTNPLQVELLELLVPEHLFVVGDEFQSIYGFRHADVEVFRKRRHVLGATDRVATLAANFRSTPQLLSTIDAIFFDQFGEDFLQPVAGVNAAPKRSELPAENPQPVELLLVDSAASSPEHETQLQAVLSGANPSLPIARQVEVELVAARIAELCRDGGFDPGDVAVLARGASSLPPVAAALVNRGIPAALAVQSLWETQTVQALFAVLRAVANPLEEPAFVGFLFASRYRCLPEEVERLQALASKDSLRLYEFAQADLSQELGDLLPAVNWLTHFRADASGLPLRQVIEHIGSVLFVEPAESAISMLCALAEKFELTDGRDLRAFLDWCAQEEASGDDLVIPTERQDGAVALMTMHAAKGLEFPAVVLVDLGRAPRGDDNDLYIDSDKVGLRLRTLDGERADAFAYEELAGQLRLTRQAEEERILYVAATRAKKQLILSATVSFTRWPRRTELAPPIAWLGPAIDADLVGGGLEAGQRCVELIDRAGGCSTVGITLHDAASAVAMVREESRQLLESLETGTLRPEPGLSGLALADLRASSVTPTSLVQHKSDSSQTLAVSPFGLLDSKRVRPVNSKQPGLRGSQRGVFTHALLEHVDFRSASLTCDPAAVAAALSLRPRSEELAAVVQGIERFLRTPLAQRIAAANEICQEYPFALNLPGKVLLNGIVDLYAQEADGSVLIVDYKTDKVRDGTNLTELVEQRYGVQRDCYALAALHTGARNVDVVYVQLSGQDPCHATFSYGREDLYILKERCGLIGRG